MKRSIALILALILCLPLAACNSSEDYILDEETFFLVMTNMQYYPEQYIGSNIEFDCFTYELQDVSGQSYLCGVRKCSAGYGCTCGNDTIIGFILDSDDTLPEPRNQSEDTNEKAWVHLSGTLNSADKTDVTIHAYLPDGTVDPDNTEQIQFLVFHVSSCDPIEDYSNLRYYVTD